MVRPRALLPTADRIPRYLTALGVGLGLVLTVEILVRLSTLDSLSIGAVGALPAPYLVSYLLSLPFIVGIGATGRYLSTEPLPPERNRRILVWCLVGIGVWLVINIATMLSFGIVSLWPAVGWVRGAVAWGGAFGLIVGLVEARAITSAVAAEEARLRAELIGEKRDAIDYVNSFLRHEVLNGVTVIQGRSQILADELPETDSRYAHVEAIARQSGSIASVVEDTRTMMESVHHQPELERIDLNEMIRQEVERALDMDATAEIEITSSTDAFVDGDHMLGRVFGNLLANAIEHNDSERPTVAVSITRSDETVTVRISDNGPGIEPAQRAALFERPAVGPVEHGFGLYIVDRLCERYGGSIELTDTGSDGTTFTVTLPRSDTTVSPTADGVAPSQSV